MQQPDVPPVAGVEFLSVKKQRGRGGCRVGVRPEVCNVRNPLFFVDDQVLDNREILRLRLLNHVLRSVAVCAPIVHVDMNVTTHPAKTRIPWKIERAQVQENPYFIACLGFDGSFLHTIFETLHRLYHDSSCRNRDHVLAAALEVVSFEALNAAHEAVICLHPCVIGSVSAAIFAGQKNASRRDLPLRIKHGDCNSSGWLQILFVLAHHLRLFAARQIENP